MEPYLDTKDSHVMLQYSYEMERQLFQTDMKFAVRLAAGQINGIFDAVRNLTLDWSLQLEQAGVLGENMLFTLTEKQEAQSVTQQFFIQNAGVVGNVSDSATVTNHQQVTGRCPSAVFAIWCNKPALRSRAATRNRGSSLPVACRD
jgi:allophanate hydrolase subunit 1